MLLVGKKIKIITCHDVYNAGASLQAYALQKYLLNLGNDVKTIDYKPDYLSQHYYLWNINPRFSNHLFTKIIYLLIKVPKRVLKRFSKRKRMYDQFKKRYLRITKCYKSNEQLKRNLPQADIYIAGSDQIWNPLFENGKNPAFYLDFVPNDKMKVSYAASLSVEEIPEENKAFVRSSLLTFDYVSVREKSAVELLESIGIKNVINVLDPVFLLDKQEWEDLCKKESESYVLVYDFDKSEEIKETAKMIANEKRAKIYSVLSCDYADKIFEKFGPKEFVSLIYNAECVISNSFHATAFSIILQKDFYVFNRSWKINTRMRDLVAAFGLRERLIEKKPNKLDKINWQQIDKIYNEKVKKSKEFIDKFLKGQAL